MRLKRGIRIFVAIISLVLFISLLKANVNLPLIGKLFYGLLIILNFNILANLKY